MGKHGARYLLSVPDPAAESVQKRLAPEAAFRKPNHIRVIERDEFAQLVTGAGLVVEMRASYGFFWAMYHALFWPCHVDFEAPHHRLLDNWCATWNALLDLPQGKDVMNALEAVMPKSQIIIAQAISPHFSPASDGVLLRRVIDGVSLNAVSDSGSVKVPSLCHRWC